MRAKALMVLGTSSGVGKSFITAGLCRLFSDHGFRVAPFKAQNMSNNSYVTEEGGEIGRAQAVQAECARVKPSVDMNPVLLKPSADDGSQVVVHGKSIGHLKARDYFSKRDFIARAMRESYERLASQYDVVVIEGAGSPAEVNLKKNDLVNMHTAEMADAQCLLVADIDRGGVFASLIGTLDLLEPCERERIAGFIINKFRGDQTLFEDGIQFLEERTGKKVFGVIPYERSIWLEEEDTVPNLIQAAHEKNGVLDIAVVLLPRMSNFTDFEVFRHEPGVRLRYVKGPQEVGNPDLLILPGTKATSADLLYIKEKGYAQVIADYVQKGGRLLGICGGYQMMGEWIVDEHGAESSQVKIEGLGFFKMTTAFEPEKILRRGTEKLCAVVFGQRIEGEAEVYEIHMGRTTHREVYASFGSKGAVHPSGRILGTYYHGLFDHGAFRTSFLESLARSAGKQPPEKASFSVHELKEMNYNKLRQMLEKSLDCEQLWKILNLETAARGK